MILVHICYGCTILWWFSSCHWSSCSSKSYFNSKAHGLRNVESLCQVGHGIVSGVVITVHHRCMAQYPRALLKARVAPWFRKSGWKKMLEEQVLAAGCFITKHLHIGQRVLNTLQGYKLQFDHLAQPTQGKFSLPYMCWWLDVSRVTLWPNPEFLPKGMSSKFLNQAIDLPAFCEFQSAEHSLLYPVWGLQYYLNCMSAFHLSRCKDMGYSHVQAQIGPLGDRGYLPPTVTCYSM